MFWIAKINIHLNILLFLNTDVDIPWTKPEEKKSLIKFENDIPFCQGNVYEHVCQNFVSISRCQGVPQGVTATLVNSTIDPVAEI